MKSAFITPFSFSHLPAGELSLMEPAGEMWSVVIESPNSAMTRAPWMPASDACGCIWKPSKNGGSAM
ncbi:hypothetical protein D3C72_1677710 [compost metagenome]